MEEVMEMMNAMSVPSIGENGAAESGTRIAFRWGVSFSAMLLLGLNLIGRRSGPQATLLALILVTSLPAVIFQILRGQFGCWVAFLSIAATYFLPCIFPVSRFLLFVVIPDWLAYELREGTVGGVFCLLLGILLIITEVQATGGCNCTCNWRCLVYWLNILPTETFEAYENPIWKKTEVEHRESLESLANLAQSLKVYNFIELQYATNEFNSSSLIKGSVYRGQMNGELTAIKKTKGDMSKEVNSLAKISHFNLIQVLGVCFNEGYWYLIYEYASNGPLDDWIFSSNPNVKFLSWTQRVQIVLDVARGLNYIHSYNSPPYVCRDVKSSKILLDSNFRAKISNFSPLKSAEGVKSHAASEKAYLSPEYRDKGQVSPKLDVYAFGILMLEVITGKRAEELYEKGTGNISEILRGIITEQNDKDRLRKMVDPNLKDNYPQESVISIAKLIEFCINGDPTSRPDMEEVVKSLSKVLNTSMTWESSI